MTYEQILSDIFTRFPAYHLVGGRAYKPGLGNMEALDERLGHPHQHFRTIHVAGTNGKGSVAHSLAACLASSGYVCGLFTSPHLRDFRERIRVDGCMIDKEAIVNFFDKHDMFLGDLQPSFFELTTALAFDYFRHVGCEVAVVEVGLGGRLDCTNIIRPDLCVITNIGLDHTKYLGSTLAEIAAEKAGIIKPGVPVVIGERHPETDPVFEARAAEVGAPIVFAQDVRKLLGCAVNGQMLEAQTRKCQGGATETHKYSLTGVCQSSNLLTVLCALDQLRRVGYDLPPYAVVDALQHVQELTGLRGRWERIARRPDIVIDTAHNAHGVRLLAEQLRECQAQYIHTYIVWGMSSDKRPEEVLRLLPTEARYLFTQAATDRAAKAADLYEIGLERGLDCHFYPTVRQAVDRARRAAEEADLIFIGGSNFVVAEALAAIEGEEK